MEAQYELSRPSLHFHPELDVAALALSEGEEARYAAAVASGSGAPAPVALCPEGPRVLTDPEHDAAACLVTVEGLPIAASAQGPNPELEGALPDGASGDTIPRLQVPTALRDAFCVGLESPVPRRGMLCTQELAEAGMSGGGLFRQAPSGGSGDDGGGEGAGGANRLDLCIGLLEGVIPEHPDDETFDDAKNTHLAAFISSVEIRRWLANPGASEVLGEGGAGSGGAAAQTTGSTRESAITK